MTSTINMPSTSMNHTTFPGHIIGGGNHRTCSFGQVSLPYNKNQIASSSSAKQSLLIDSNYSTPKVATSFTRSSTTCTTTTSTITTTLSHLWRELQGCNDWEDLVLPLHPLLRQEIIRYGEFVTACYKAFDLDPNSKRYLNCKYGKKTVLRDVGLGNSGYQVTKYIYATPDISIPIQNGASCGRWIGYVAVSSDAESKRLGRRDVLVTFRGTVTNPEWIANLMSSLTPARLDPHNPRPEVKVESGFLSLYTSDETTSNKFGLESCREQLLSEITRIINMYKSEEMSITIAGHSMGSSLGLLLAYDIAELGLNRNEFNRVMIPLTVFSFAGPRVGNSGFKERCEELGVKVLRIVNVNDPITKLPGVFFNENFRVLMGGKYEFPWSCSCYAHVGVELALDFFKMQNPSCVHDLESYISLLRLPKRSVRVKSEEDEEGFDYFLSRAKEMFSSAQNFDISPWRDAACNMVNLVQSQRT